jgi:2-keto-4-pentenoate hydratase/2-oxohepta-3-ene-1,7-dioic acid hydratase in catechol pathway
MVTEDTFLDVSSVVKDFNEEFFASGGLDTLPSLVRELTAQGHTPIALEGHRVGAPIARPHQIVCIGLNYADHAAETGAQIPSEPIIFTKSPNTLIGPHDSIRIPRGSRKTDWEVELGIVIGKRARYLEGPEQAAEHIAGFMICNDVSEREFQLERQGQWSKGKSCETFNPAGPWLVTLDELDPSPILSMTLTLNGVVMQDSSTQQMVFTPPFLVHYLSQFMVLEPGDVINTGTPPGVGLGQKPEKYLAAGDQLTLHIEGLGTQRHGVIGPEER